MSQLLNSEPPETLTSILGDAVDLMDVGVLLLNPALRVRLVNARLRSMFHLPQALLARAPGFRDLLDLAGQNGWFTMPADRLSEYLDQREAAVRSCSSGPALISLHDGRRLLFSCTASPDGGRILTYTDISRELRHAAHDAVDRINVELRFSIETMEQQAAHLASLAEAADESSRRIEASRLQLEQEMAERAQLEAQLRQLATIDGLTGALNRSAFMAAAERALRQTPAPDHQLAVLMLDVDHFKAINDRYGHAGGDLALQHLVSTLRTAVRQNDLLGRLGGEEFAVLLRATMPDTAEQIAERLRRQVAESPVAREDQWIEITVSVGLAIHQETDENLEQLIGRADAALYRAKRAGRNRLITDTPAGVP